MDSDTKWGHIDAERAWLADLLDSLPDHAWQHPSLCAGWTVRDVGAHLTFAQARVRDMWWPAVRAGLRYDALVRDTAVRCPLTREEIVATLRGFVGSRRRVAFITDAEPLIDILVHTQDICVPLGIEHPMPVAAAAAAADRVLTTPWPIRRWTPPRNVSLVATDIEWVYGTGPQRLAPIQDHLLGLTGRQVPSRRPDAAGTAFPPSSPPHRRPQEEP